jgi:murein DD-endopeptidase MepM/ murein hydrolase activator NlpD
MWSAFFHGTKTVVADTVSTAMIKYCVVALICAVLLSSCFVLQNSSVVYRLNKTLPDTAAVYSLPFAPGTAVTVWQGYYSLFSHWGNFAVDFRVTPGTPVHAARSGVVVVVKQENKWGGVGRRFVGKENAVVVQHADGSYAHYLHFQHKRVVVAVGDTVTQGQLIGFSGSTGFSAFPHLHFEVTKGLQKGTAEIPVRFKTSQGARLLQPLQCYKAL